MGGACFCFLLCSFLFSVLIGSSHASHHVWDEASLMAVQKAKPKPVSSSNAYRTVYHFQPLKNWMNDPNAPLFYKGYYHLFYQFNPFSAVWGSIRWGHAVSKDLINWEHLAGAALYPDSWYDINGAWSGSATFLQKGGAPVILYTGNTNASIQVTNMAVPKNLSDPLLREWTKISENPVMVPQGGINGSSFRDPTTAWLGSDKLWRVLVGNKKDKNKVGRSLLYRSKDFKKWVRTKHPLHSATHTGMWECPDFYSVAINGTDAASFEGPSVKHVLKNSLDDSKVDYYTVGKYFPKIERYVPDNGSIEGPNGLRYDYGKFYASKTFFDDNKSRRILWGWINESDSVSDDITKGWASVQAIPRIVRLDSRSKNSLIQWPVSEVEALRGSSVTKQNVVLKSGTFMKVDGLNSGAAQVDVEVEFELGHNVEDHVHETVDDIDLFSNAQNLCMMTGSAGENIQEFPKGLGLVVLASGDMRERSVVSFRFFKHVSNQHLRRTVLCVDQSRSGDPTEVSHPILGSPNLTMQAIDKLDLISKGNIGTFGTSRRGSAEKPTCGPNSKGTSGKNGRGERGKPGSAKKENFRTNCFGTSGTKIREPDGSAEMRTNSPDENGTSGPRVRESARSGESEEFVPQITGTSGTNGREPVESGEPKDFVPSSTGTSGTNGRGGPEGAQRAENQPNHDTCHKGNGQKVKGRVLKDHPEPMG
ncbi:hypothetical protein KI387_013541 [Taxus chinensis]|uniref:Glycosyl hydrolase family 32 N-terminal domain-containing protein n=1 Tax=Taxus chinensis TaxID=29808 RepID=A0AA38FGS8_TAXCH|nr:hypothetical protein KI387_013541 [Taxus chinensis]